MAAAATAGNTGAGAVSSIQALRILTKVQLAGMRDTESAGGSSRVGALVAGVGKNVLLALVAIAVSLGVGGVYAFLAPESIPGIAVTVAAVLGLFFTFSDAAGSIFGFRDYDLVMSLPISTRVVIVSRVGALFARQLMWSALVMVPMYVMFFLAVSVSAAGIVTAIVSILFAAAVPVSVSILLAFLLAVFSTRFKYAGAFYIVIGLAGMLALMFASSFVGMSGEGSGAMDLGAFSQGARTVACFYPMAGLAVAAAQGAWVQLLIFAAVSVVVVAATIEILARTFMGINALLSTGSSAGPAVNSRRDRVSSPVWAMAIKDLKLVLSLPQLAMNMFFGGILLLIFGGLALVMGHDAGANAMLSGYLAMSAETAAFVLGKLDVFMPWVFAFCLGTASLTAILVSMEGSSAWVMATAPVPVRDLMAAKILTGQLWSAPVAVLSAVFLLIGGYSAPGVVTGVVLGLASALLMSALGQLIDVRHPNYTWTAPAQVIKRSRPVAVTSITLLVVIVAGAAASFFLALNLGDAASYACALAVAVAELIAAWVCFNRTAKTPLYLNR